MKLRLAVLVAGSVTLACSSPDPSQAPPSPGSPAGGGAPSAGAPSADPGGTSGAGASVGGSASADAGSAGTAGSPASPPVRPRCSAPAGMGAGPETIDEAVQWLNALPKPTSAACFLESLPRPLALFATNSQFSAQPALSNASPRLFIELGRLWISAVIDGEASYLLEFGYRPPEDELSSIKGELQMPLDGVISANTPYEKVRYRSGTTCGFCHGNEQAVATLSPDAFVSNALRPRPESRVNLAWLLTEHQSCNWAENAHRCEMLSAVFDGGPVNETSFPDTMPTFF